jgi:hypothetical protein
MAKKCLRIKATHQKAQPLSALRPVPRFLAQVSNVPPVFQEIDAPG